jgi:O-antigen ligase
MPCLAWGCGHRVAMRKKYFPLVTDCRYVQHMNTYTQAFGVLLVFVLIFPTALVNLVLLLWLVSYGLSGNYADKWRQMRGSPVALSSLLLFGLFALGVAYSSAPLSEALSSLQKYRELLLLPLAMTTFNQAHWRQRAYYAFFAAILLAVLLSFAMRLGWLPPGSAEQEWVPFKARIAYGFFLAIAAYLMAHHTLRSNTTKQRALWLGALLLVTLDLWFLVSGRTGHFVFLVLLVLLAYQHWQALKKHLLMALVTTVTLGALVLSYSPAIHERSHDIDQAMSNPEASSIGQRLIFWQTSVRVVAQRPLFGGGTGSFAESYAQQSHSSLLTVNPHNEYLLIASQLGVLGLLGFVYSLYRQWRQANTLDAPYQAAAQGVVLAMAIGCLFNSFLYDHGEGHFYAIYLGMLSSGAVRERQSK